MGLPSNLVKLHNHISEKYFFFAVQDFNRKSSFDESSFVGSELTQVLFARKNPKDHHLPRLHGSHLLLSDFSGGFALLHEPSRALFAPKDGLPDALLQARDFYAKPEVLPALSGAEVDGGRLLQSPGRAAGLPAGARAEVKDDQNLFGVDCGQTLRGL